jgi:cytochrome c oxidase assembly protein subunit 15
VSGVLPPLSAAAWEAEFARYRATPEFQLDAPHLTLAGFKRIYFWEYVHRLWARLVGVVIAIPALVGLARGWFAPWLRGRLLVLALLTGLQGALGWYMVQSGLSDRTDVSQYRLAAHLGLALVIFMIALWTAADLFRGRAAPRVGRAPPVRRHALATVAVVLLTAIAGAFVAGTNAGKTYNEFPLMAGRIVPAGYFSLDPWYRNLFENVAAVQFNHRLLAVLALVVAIALGARLWRAGVAELGMGIMVTATLQFGLGLATLLGSVPIGTAALHQAGAVVLLGLALLAVHRTTGHSGAAVESPPAPDAPAAAGAPAFQPDDPPAGRPRPVAP